jgi:hypothetical protein
VNRSARHKDEILFGAGSAQTGRSTEPNLRASARLPIKNLEN